MKWPVPLLLGYILLALEAPVAEALRFGPTHAAPSLVFPLVAFLALMASTNAALWMAFIVGLAVDLTTLRAPGAVIVAGPHALGYAAAAYMIITLRPMVMRKNPITLVVLSIAGEGLAALVVVAIFAIRRALWHGAWTDDFFDSLLTELGQRCIGACFTGVAAIVLAAAFYPLIPWFGFQDPAIRRAFTRRY